MSNPGDHQAPVTAEVRDPKAQAKADKAYAKAMRPWYKKKRFILPLALLLIIIIVAVNGGGSGDDTANTAGSSQPAATEEAPAQQEEEQPAAEEEAPPAEAGIGTPVRDGKFEFVVTGLERPGKTIGPDFLQETAQGEFVIVRVDVSNIGNEAQTLDSSSQVLYDDQGREFSPSSAMFVLDDADKAFLEQINPGNKVTGVPILFDVPEGTNLTSIELHDSPFSGGVTVSLVGS